MRSLPTALLDFDDLDAPPGLHVPAPPAPPDPEVIPSSQPREELERARAQAFDDGYQHGLTAAATAQAAELVAAVRAVAAGLDNAGAQAGQAAESAAEAILKLIIEIITVGYPTLQSRYGEQEIRRLVDLVVPSLRDEARIVVNVAPALADSVAGELASMIAESEGRMSVAPMPSIAPGDARIEWKDGSAVRDSTKVWSSIVEILGPLGLLPDTEPAAQAADMS